MRRARAQSDGIADSIAHGLLHDASGADAEFELSRRGQRAGPFTSVRGVFFQAAASSAICGDWASPRPRGAESPRRAVGHHRQQQHRGDADGFRGVEQHLRQPIRLRRILRERPRRGRRDELVGRVDQPERGGRAFVQREASIAAR